MFIAIKNRQIDKYRQVVQINQFLVPQFLQSKLKGWNLFSIYYFWLQYF